MLDGRAGRDDCGTGVGWLRRKLILAEERGPLVGTLSEVILAEERRRLGGVEHVGRLLVGGARSGVVGESGAWRGGHAVVHDVLGGHGHDVGAWRRVVVDWLERGKVVGGEVVVPERAPEEGLARRHGEVEVCSHV